MSKLGRYSADRKKISALTAAKTVQTSDCGTIFTLGNVDGFAVVLPDASKCGAGWWCRFVVKVAPTTEYTIDASSGDASNMHGFVTYSSGSHTVTAGDSPAQSSNTSGTAVDTITFVANKALIGDSCELYTDGSLWYVTLRAEAYDGITIT
tara:strand:+ start:220 stop:672 length:453 start_codon:yes stop_codon:yes gene_type:complete